MPTLDDLRDASGAIIGVAVDHRDSFLDAMAAAGWMEASPETIAELKLAICDALAPAASMVLVDDATLEHARALGRELAEPFAMPLEAQGYGAPHRVERTRFVERPRPLEMAELGAAAAKLLLPIRPDRAAHVEAQLEVAEQAVAACRTAGLPLILEPIVAADPQEQLDERAELVVAAAQLLAPLAPGLLKLQYPGSAADCVRLHEACAGHPWVLLGGGAPLDELAAQVADACAAGAIGYIVGRSLWAGVLRGPRERRRAHLRDVAEPALRRLVAIVHEARAAGHPPDTSGSPA